MYSRFARLRRAPINFAELNPQPLPPGPPPDLFAIIVVGG